MSIVAQVQRAFSPRRRLAAVIGLAWGAIVPVAIYQVSHGEAGRITRDPASWVPWGLVLFGLVYSAHTVFCWSRLALGSTVKSLGFVVLMEGVMVLSTTVWLRLLVLGYLVAINAISTACRISLGRSAELREA